MHPQELATKYPHLLSWNPQERCLELYVDHHVLSTLRVCEAKFVEEHLNLIGPSSKGGIRYWSLEFGQLLHEGLDIFYKHFKTSNSPPPFNDFLKIMADKWDKYDMEYFCPKDKYGLVAKIKGDHKKYYTLGGWDEGKSGFLALLTEYYAWHMNQRQRVVDTEISFGRAKEVYLGKIEIPYKYYYFGTSIEELGSNDFVWEKMKVKVYLSGRIDLLVDNGYKIGPVDHKSTIKFDGYESNDFDPHEGITGYIFAINSILQNRFPNNPHKICNTGWIYHISISQDSPRFKPSFISKTPEQIESFRYRQLRSAKRIMELITGEVPDWNTMACNNIYNSQCSMKELHRQPAMQREATIKQFYEIRKPWNPAEPPPIQRTAQTNNDNSKTNTDNRNGGDSSRSEEASDSSSTN